MTELLSFDDLVVEAPPEIVPDDTVNEPNEAEELEPDVEEGPEIIDEDESSDGKDPSEDDESAVNDTTDTANDDEVSLPETKVLQGKTLTGHDLDGKDVGLHSSTFVPVKIDGVDSEVQLQELINNYSGSISYDKKFSNLDTKNRDFDQRVSVLDTHLNSVFEKAEIMKSADNPEDKRAAAMEVLQMFGNLTGGNSFELVNSLRGAFLDEARAMQDMDEIDLKRHEFELEKGFSDKNKALTDKRANDNKKFEDFNKQSLEIQKDYNFDSSEFSEVKSELEGLVSSGKVQVEVTPSTVLEYRTAKLVNEAMKEHTPELLNDNDFYYKLIDYSVKEKFTTQELEVFLKEVNGQSQKKERRTKNINRKVKAASVAKPKAKPKPVENTRAHYSNSIDLWDDV